MADNNEKTDVKDDPDQHSPGDHSHSDSHCHRTKHSCRRRSKLARFIGWSIFLAVIAAIVMFIAFCFRSADGHMHWMIEKIEDRYELNEEQTAQLMVMGDVLLIARDQLQSQRTERVEQIADIFAAESFDSEKSLAAWKEINHSLNEQVELFVAETAKFHALLTPEQRMEMADKLRKLKYRRWGRH
ncbi:Spy/CpxP family protein refolding chaperone [Motiliproteus sp. MSK22-1]|uniref:Spy/CpxP family protein refolding chaperone n=1 Tax=Motiliproteus sp. MSK22-1 TaxID=1897630 RepID=UPI000975D933|nr:Spy/CpxP family protein refolding chaperone [Motiliproteus sp. MSK22-1]OMH38917.1 hypothetical protein BGP75_00660 [Motiliproteus sp. MSK22-1]